MPGISATRTTIPLGGKAFSFARYWKTQNIFDFLWTGNIEGDELVDISGNGNNLLITDKDFTGNYIPATSSATFSIPDDAALKADDAELFWHDSGDNILQKSAADLVASDYQKTIIKYDSTSPYNVRWIGMLKSTVTLTAEQTNKLHESFELWLYWSSVLNAYGVIKGNRFITSIPTVASAEITDASPDEVVITFDQALDAGSVPAASAFALAGKTISSVAVAGSTVILTVTVAYEYGNSGIAVIYTKPLLNPIASDIDGTKAASFSQSVTNSIADPYGPELIANMTFDADTWWDKQAGTTISSGVCHISALGSVDASGSRWCLNKSLVTVTNTYKLEFDARPVSATGNFQVSNGYTIHFNTTLSAGWTHYTLTFTAAYLVGPASDNKLVFGGANSGDTFEVDNISLKLVL